MSMQDPIANMFVIVKNGQAVGKKEVVMPGSKLKLAIAKLLKDEGYIVDYSIAEVDAKQILSIQLKYYQDKPVISMLKRVSRPGIRVYKQSDNLPKVMDGLGVAIISTSKGLMTDRKAKAQNLGGEIIGVVA